MCTTCGCGHDEHVTVLRPGEIRKIEGNGTGLSFHTHEPHHHGYGDPGSEYDHDHHEKTIIEVEKDILSNNQMLAERNRGFFEAKNILAINLVSSPGSGKTTLLETTLRDLQDELTFSVIEGDQQTFNDANRIDALNIPVVQINTGKGCHLDSEMVYNAFKKLDLQNNSVLMIENVGNLVCPAMFDLGEKFRVVIISTTEGEDKPIKYPDMFMASQICLINKTDLLPYLDFNVEKLKEYALRVNPRLQFFEVSATTGDGISAWYHWLKENSTVTKTK
jgi:hydrogenase nickel incorporation protein HypB